MARKKDSPPHLQGRRATSYGREYKGDKSGHFHGTSPEDSQMITGTYGTETKRKGQYTVIGYNWHGRKIAGTKAYGRSGVKEVKSHVRQRFPHRWKRYEVYSYRSQKWIEGKAQGHFK